MAKKLQAKEKMAEALPEAFLERMERLLGEEYPEFLASYERRPVCSLRMNGLKKGMAPDQYQRILEELGISAKMPVPWTGDGFYYEESPVEEEGGCRPGRHPYHEMGLYYIQEASAMAPAVLLGAKPGERILDLCAAPGGKTAQLAAALGQRGLLVSNEINPGRAKILSRNVERMGVANALVLNEDSGRLAECFPGFFHRILVDAPCSGEGMFRKHPQARGEWSPDQVAICARRQAQILDNAARMLMPGGRLVYSTCTFAPEEDEETVAEFVRRHPEFRLADPDAEGGVGTALSPGRPEWGGQNLELKRTRRLWPQHLRGEGHFAAVLIREGRLPAAETWETESAGTVSGKGAGGGRRRSSGKNKKQESAGPDKAQSACISDFAEAVLAPQLRELFTRGEGLTLFGDQLYRLPEGTPELTGLAVLRPGLHLGTFKKGRFEPAHALALFLGKEEVIGAAELERESVDRYLRGESLPWEGENGWVLLCFGGFSAGWAKASGGMLKNHYPKGLRIF